MSIKPFFAVCDCAFASGAAQRLRIHTQCQRKELRKWQDPLQPLPAPGSIASSISSRHPQVRPSPWDSLRSAWALDLSSSIPKVDCIEPAMAGCDTHPEPGGRPRGVHRAQWREQSGAPTDVDAAVCSPSVAAYVHPSTVQRRANGGRGHACGLMFPGVEPIPRELRYRKPNADMNGTVPIGDARVRGSSAAASTRPTS